MHHPNAEKRHQISHAEAFGDTNVKPIPADQMVTETVSAKNTLLIGAFVLFCSVNTPLVSTTVPTAKYKSEIINVASITFLLYQLYKAAYNDLNWLNDA